MSGDKFMAKCAVCGKGPMTGNNVSHSHLKTRRVWQPNVKKVKIELNGKVQKKNVCTRCLRTGKVKKII